MPTAKRRINITIGDDEYAAIERLAKRDKRSVSGVSLGLIERALELEEDRSFSHTLPFDGMGLGEQAGNGRADLRACRRAATRGRLGRDTGAATGRRRCSRAARADRAASPIQRACTLRRALVAVKRVFLEAAPQDVLCGVG